MTRKVLISFLGAITYHDTIYYFADNPEEKYEPTGYVQEVVMSKLLAKNWNFERDKALIFTTKEAFENNWKSRIRGFKENKAQFDDPPQKGLSAFFDENPNIQHESVLIENGYDKEEIWKVFRQIFDKLDEGDEVYFDVTYGFRSLPMLALVLLNYAKVVKNISIKAIFYGNYETGRAKQQEKLEQTKNDPEQATKIKAQPVEAPILDVSSFAELQDWTRAAHGFLQFGDASDLSNLSKDSYPKLSEQASKFTEGILTSRGKFLVDEFDYDDFFRTLGETNFQDDLKEQLRPLLQKIAQKLSDFQNDEIQNGFKAVDWCIQHQLIPQGYTLLQETLITWLIKEKYGQTHIYDYKNYRLLANGALNGYHKYKPSKDDSDHEKSKKTKRQQEMYDFLNQNYNKVITAYKKMTGKDGLRNDVNHGGFKEDYASPEDLKNELEDLYQNFRQILNI